MFKFIAPIILATALINTAQASFNECIEYFPNNRPTYPAITPEIQAREICFDSFAVLHSGLTKTPLFTVEKLNQERLQDAGDEERTDNFYPEARLPSSHRAQLSDYARSGYDRGHMAPAADMPNPNAMAQSFSLANMIPQDPNNNRKIWSKLESDVRKYAKRAQGDVFVFTGPFYLNQEHKTIGKNDVWVPEKLFKLVYDNTTKKAWAFIVDNTADAKINKPISYQEFVKITGLELLPNLPIAP